MSRFAVLLLIALTACGDDASNADAGTEPVDLGADTGADGFVPSVADTDAQLETHYGTHGGRDAFSERHLDALETLLRGEDDVARGDLDAARARLDALLSEHPFDPSEWPGSPTGVNVGSPVAYYGLRMLDQILRLGGETVTGTLQLTVVVALCADVSRPTLPDLEAEEVRLDIDPRIVADDARVLHQATALFRRWVQAITGGLELRLVVHEMTECTTVSYTDDGSTIVSYPDASAMVDSVPAEVLASTNLWWVVAPSGVPGDGSGFDRHFITGGMGGYGPGQPLFLSDDAWFLRKPEHLGSGDYTDVERRAYQPQWFQHEFMHHLFRTWPEYGLEENGHQWFDRGTWPDDFVGSIEPDYYAEAIEKRLLAADPTLAEGLSVFAPAPFGPSDLESLAGSYERRPVENGWHEVTITATAGTATWSNAAGASWALDLEDGRLRAEPGSPYEGQEVFVERGDGDAITGLFFGGERYERL